MADIALIRWLPVFLLIAVRLRDAAVRPPWHGYDAYGHLVYLAEVASGRLPAPDESWAAYHAPLYYVVSALFAKLTGLPVERAGMLVSGLASSAVVLVTWRIARSLSPRLAWPATILMAMLPATIMSGAMAYNLALGELFWALFLLLYLHAWQEERIRLPLELALGSLAGLGMLTRPEGIGMVGMLGALWLWRCRIPALRRDALLALGLAGALVAGFTSWVYLRNLADFGRPFVHNADPDTFPLFYTDRSLYLTLPGFRALSHYLDPGLQLWAQPCSPGAYTSFPAIVYASIWWDYFQAFLSRTPAWLGRLCLLGGLLPTALAGMGLVGAWRRRGPAWVLPLSLVIAFAAALTLAITFKLPTWCADKGSYAYPAFVPCALLAAQALAWLEDEHPPAARLVRGALVVLALFYAWAFWA